MPSWGDDVSISIMHTMAQKACADSLSFLSHLNFCSGAVEGTPSGTIPRTCLDATTNLPYTNKEL